MKSALNEDDYNSLVQSVMQSVNNPNLNGNNKSRNFFIFAKVLVSNQFLNYLTDRNKSPLLQNAISNSFALNSVLRPMSSGSVRNQTTVVNGSGMSSSSTTLSGTGVRHRQLSGLVNDSINVITK